MDKIKKEIIINHVSIWLEGNILCGLYEDVHIDLVKAKQIVKERIETFGTEDRLGLIEVKGNVSFTKEARDYLGGKEACVGVYKLAIIASSPITITLGNIFLQISKPPVTTRLFSNKEDAKKWLMKK